MGRNRIQSMADSVRGEKPGSGHATPKSRVIFQKSDGKKNFPPKQGPKQLEQFMDRTQNEAVEAGAFLEESKRPADWLPNWPARRIRVDCTASRLPGESLHQQYCKTP
jgi:hypothetical protein